MSNQLLLRRRMMMGIKEPDYLTFTALANASSVALTKVGSPNDIPMEYRVNRGAWQAYTYGDTIAIDSGDNVQMRNSSATVYSQLSTGSGDYFMFYTSGSLAASGNVMSLLDKTCKSKTVGERCFFNLFRETNITTPPCLPATTLGDYCYKNLFVASAITAAPVLPARILGIQSYQSIFEATGVSYVKTYMLNISAEYAIRYWLSNTARIGTLVCDSSLTLPSGGSGLPTGWTRVNLDGTPYQP